MIPNVLLFFFIKKKRNCFHCDRIKRGKCTNKKKLDNIFRLDLKEAIAPQHVLMLDIALSGLVLLQTITDSCSTVHVVCQCLQKPSAPVPVRCQPAWEVQCLQGNH